MSTQKEDDKEYEELKNNIAARLSEKLAAKEEAECIKTNTKLPANNTMQVNPYAKAVTQSIKQEKQSELTPDEHNKDANEEMTSSESATNYTPAKRNRNAINLTNTMQKKITFKKKQRTT